jgi:Fe-S cluster biogenesis protein NfuA/nitrite reductase/ring-hydroxylating ferredoxin subunit
VAETRDLRAVGDRVEGLLGELRSLADPAVTDKAEEVVRLLVELYGAAIERVLELLVDEPGGQERIERLTEDPLVASLLVLHGLHPLATEERVHRALESVRPYLGSHAGGVEFLGVDASGVAQLKLEGSCEGCASSTVTVKLAIEKAINDAAPELAGIHVEGVADPLPPGPTLLQIQPFNDVPEPEPEPDWVELPGTDGVAEGAVWSVDAVGARILLCRVGGTLLAYADACAACGAGLTGGTLEGTRLSCPTCGRGWDVRLAGRSLDGLDAHLDPLPLLGEGEQVRVVPPARVGS